MISFGTAPRPCPTVAPAVTFPTYFTIENPAFVFACTVLVILPSPSLLVVPPPAFQHQATYLTPLSFVSLLLPKVKPSVSKDVILDVLVISATVLFEFNILFVPLVLSVKL